MTKMVINQRAPSLVLGLIGLLLICSSCNSSEDANGNDGGLLQDAQADDSGLLQDTQADDSGLLQDTQADDSGLLEDAQADDSGQLQGDALVFDGSETASSDGDGSSSLTDISDVSPLSCQSDEECDVGGCCFCDPIGINTSINCDGLGCASPNCKGLSAKCESGQCTIVPANCDPATVTCKAMEPTCSDFGFYPEVENNCWTGVCIPIENCSPDCSDGYCPWRCPQYGDQIKVVQVGAEVVLENETDGHIYECTLTYDIDDDDFDCDVDMEVDMTFSLKGGPAANCSKDEWGIQLGDPGVCSYHCTTVLSSTR